MKSNFNLQKEIISNECIKSVFSDDDMIVIRARGGIITEDDGVVIRARKC